MPTQTCKVSPDNVWAHTCTHTIVRSSPCGIYNEPLDPGVNYFVLMLEQLGATTQYSCEGHPNNFYVLFSAPYEIALDVAACGYFRVEIEGINTWSLRPYNNLTEPERVQLLKNAAASWERKLGPLRQPRTSKKKRLQKPKRGKKNV
jgi:hypothetical protein